MKTVTYSMKMLILFGVMLLTSCQHQEKSKKETSVVSDLKINPVTNSLSRLRVEGNKFVNEAGNQIVLAGVNIGDLIYLEQEKHLTESYIKKCAEWGARLIRVPIHPGAYREIGHDNCMILLDSVVDWSKKYGMYVMVDWHSIGNPVQDIFLDPVNSYFTTNEETIGFWRAVAERYRNEPIVAFYELFNEPSAIEWKDGKMKWTEWRDQADEIIDAIYLENPDAIPVVGGIRFSFDLRDVGREPIKNRGVAYAVHPYPGNAEQPWKKNWEEYFGYLAKDYPLIFTEFGFDPEDEILPDAYRADTVYGRQIIDFAIKRNISWTAFVFYKSQYWPMHLFKNWEDYEPTTSGNFFKSEMIEAYRKAQDVNR